MKIETGLFNHMVLQRNGRNVCDAEVAGVCEGGGAVLCKVSRGGKAINGYDGKRIGTASRGKFKAKLKGLPVGGPYTVELSVGAEKTSASDVLVGDVWLLGGQSNMQGCGLMPKRRLQVGSEVRAFFMNDRWGAAKDPIHSLWESVDQVHADLSGGSNPPKPEDGWGTCPGPAFGVEMRKLTGVPQGLIACAHGGTTMAQWNPALKKEGGKSLYGAMLRRFRKNGGKVAGLVWYQGCSDAGPGVVDIYTSAMKKFVASLRRDCSAPNMPVAMVQISRYVSIASPDASYWNAIQEQQRLLPKHIRNLAVVPAIDLSLDDMIHLGGEAHYILGPRLARAMQVLRNGRKAGLPQIALKGTRIENDRAAWSTAIVEFDNVEGELTSCGRPSGFSVINSRGESCVYDIKLSGSRVYIRTCISPSMMCGARLHYGYGFDPYCNISDDAGRALPVFGPVWLGTPRAVSPFIRDFRVSDYQALTGDFKNVSFPSDMETLGFRKKTFPGNFCSMRYEISTHGGREEYFYYACRISCPEPMKIALLLGYEGPVKAWIDGDEVFFTPTGKAPTQPELSTSKAKQLDKGEHEILIALNTNGGKGCGIFLELGRQDLKKTSIVSGPGSYVFPEVLG